MKKLNLGRFAVTVLAGCTALCATYCLTALFLVTVCDPQPSTTVLVVGIGAQLLVCPLASFLAGREAYRRVGAESNSTQQPTSAPGGARG